MVDLNTVTFEKELQFFIDNQDGLVSKYCGKVLAIKGQAVVGVYQNAFEAYTEAQKEHQLGTFMIQRCEPGEDAHTVYVPSLNLMYVPMIGEED